MEVRQMRKTSSEIVLVKKKIRLQEWEHQIEEQKSSGLNVQDWCTQNGIKVKTYYYHLRRVREEVLNRSRTENKQVQNDTVRAVVPIPTVPSDRNITIEKNGLHISLPSDIAADTLLALVGKLC